MVAQPIQIELLTAGYCTQKEFLVIRGGKIKQINFPALVLLIQHPQHGWMLWDTGYAQHFLDATKYFPFRFYRWLTPTYIPPEKNIVAQIQAKGLSTSDIKHIIVSHFHADHVGGLKDFPEAKFIYLSEALQKYQEMSVLSSLRKGFLQQLIPSDIANRTISLETKPWVELPPELSPFSHGWDIWQDGTMLAVPLPGHAWGQIGLFIHASQWWFFVADACWIKKTYETNTSPSFLARPLFVDWQKNLESIAKIHQLYKHNSEIKIVPTHCIETIQSLQKLLTEKLIVKS